MIHASNSLECLPCDFKLKSFNTDFLIYIFKTYSTHSLPISVDGSATCLVSQVKTLKFAFSFIHIFNVSANSVSPFKYNHNVLTSWFNPHLSLTLNMKAFFFDSRTSPLTLSQSNPFNKIVGMIFIKPKLHYASLIKLLQ